MVIKLCFFVKNGLVEDTDDESQITALQTTLILNNRIIMENIWPHAKVLIGI